MKKYDLVRSGDSIIRVLDMQDDRVLVIDCIKHSMPVWVDVESLKSGMMKCESVHSELLKPESFQSKSLKSELFNSEMLDSALLESESLETDLLKCESSQSKSLKHESLRCELSKSELLESGTLEVETLQSKSLQSESFNPERLEAEILDSALLKSYTESSKTCSQCSGKEFSEVFICTDDELFEATGVVIADIDDLDADQRKVMYERYTMITPILPFLSDDKMRSKLICSIAEDHHVSKQTVRNYLCLYLSYLDV